jgi:hypothetical protein
MGGSLKKENGLSAKAVWDHTGQTVQILTFVVLGSAMSDFWADNLH